MLNITRPSLPVRLKAAQAGKLNAPVLYVNSVCPAREAARGGAALFENGSIKAELPAGQEGILIVEA